MNKEIIADFYALLKAVGTKFPETQKMVEQGFNEIKRKYPQINETEVIIAFFFFILSLIFFFIFNVYFFIFYILLLLDKQANKKENKRRN